MMDEQRPRLVARRGWDVWLRVQCRDAYPGIFPKLLDLTSRVHGPLFPSFAHRLLIRGKGLCDDRRLLPDLLDSSNQALVLLLIVRLLHLNLVQDASLLSKFEELVDRTDIDPSIVSRIIVPSKFTHL